MDTRAFDHDVALEEGFSPEVLGKPNRTYFYSTFIGFIAPEDFYPLINSPSGFPDYLNPISPPSTLSLFST